MAAVLLVGGPLAEFGVHVPAMLVHPDPRSLPPAGLETALKTGWCGSDYSN